MDIDFHDFDGLRLIRILAPRVDAAESVQFKDAVRDAADGGPPRIVLDMSAVTFLDSSGLGAVVGSMKLLSPRQTLELACLTAPVAKVFRLTRMDTVMCIHETLPIADPAGSAGVDEAHAL